MGMPIYRVTEKKLEEHLGEPFIGYFDRFKSKRFRLVSILLIASGLLTTILILIGYFVFSKWADQLLWLLIIFWLIILFIFILFFFLLKSQFRSEIAGKMKELVNDPELLWVNSKSSLDTLSRWDRASKGSFSPVTFQILAYLKKERTAQGIYTKIKSMKNSSSASKTLKRLADKKVFDEAIVKWEDGDYKYIPWKFKLIDEKNRPINIKRAEKIEKLLEKCWEEGLEEDRR